MSTITKITLAVEIAERFMADHGYLHGPCLAAKVNGSLGDSWEVEFAYHGLSERSPTTDPASIIVSVDVSTGDVRPVELM